MVARSQKFRILIYVTAGRALGVLGMLYTTALAQTQYVDLGAVEVETKEFSNILATNNPLVLLGSVSRLVMTGNLFTH